MNMQIHSRSTLSAMYRPPDGATPIRTSGEAQKVGGDSADRVTISKDALARLDASQNLNQSRVSAVGRYRDAVIRNAEADASAAEKMASELAHDVSYAQTGPLVDISNLPKITYTYTGEPVTNENMAAFKSEATKVSSGRLALYNEEKSKGTPDAQIIKKIFDYDDRQSEQYQKITGTYDFVQDKLASRALVST